MKQLIMLRLFFYLYIAGTAINLEAAITQEQTYAKLDDVCATLHILQKIDRDIGDLHDDLSEQEQVVQEDCMTAIMIVLIGTHEKIIGATVTHYLMMHMPIQQNLHQTIAIILAEDFLKVINILRKQLVHFLLNDQMTLQKKILYCSSIISMIIMIKIGIDQIPQSIQSPPEGSNLVINNNDGSGYLNNKFGNYR